MPKELRPVPPLERLAKRICKAAAADGSEDIAAVIESFRRRSSYAIVKGGLQVAVAKQWLRYDGKRYALTEAGTVLGSPKSRPKLKRAMPF